MNYKLLTYLGTMPFVIGALSHFYGYYFSYDIVQIYSLIIFSFMNGTYWSFGFKNKNINDSKILYVSNFLALLIWVIFFSDKYFFYLSFLFIIIISIDYYIYRKKIIDIEYLKTRIAATIIIIPSLLYFGNYEISMV